MTTVALLGNKAVLVPRLRESWWRGLRIESRISVVSRRVGPCSVDKGVELNVNGTPINGDSYGFGMYGHFSGARNIGGGWGAADKKPIGGRAGASTPCKSHA